LQVVVVVQKGGGGVHGGCPGGGGAPPQHGCTQVWPAPHVMVPHAMAHSPLWSSCAPAACRAQSLPYVLPSQPQTGT
jgi:hypothetical protein